MIKPDNHQPNRDFKVRQQNYAILLLIVLITVFTDQSSGQIIEINTPLRQYISEGLQNNPDLEVWQHKVDAAKHDIPQAGAWADPTIGLGFMNLPVNSFDLNQEPMTGIWINAAQMIPLAGKPALKTSIAQQSLNSIKFDQDSKELSISSILAQTWYDWAYLKAALQTVDKNIELIDDLTVTARTKYETGRGMQQDVLRAETKRTQLEDMRVGISQMVLTTSRRFAVLLGRTESDNLVQPTVLPTAFTTLDSAELIEKLIELNPTYQRAKTDVELAETKSELTRRSWYPDLKLGAGYGYRQNADNGMERPDFLTVTAGVSVPLYGKRKQSNAVQEMLAMERATQSKLRSVALELKFQLDRLLDEDRRLAEQIELYLDGIEPQAEATLAASVSSYAVGKADFEALLMGETMLYNARLEKLARVRDRIKVRASIAALVGGDSLLKETSEND